MTTDSETASSPRGGRANVRGGLIGGAWLAHRTMVLWAVTIWVLAAWVLVLLFHPGFILAMGMIYAMLAGTLFGGTQTLWGTQEYALSLPPTRGQRYWAGMLMAVGTTLGLTLAGVVTIALDLPQRAWSLVVESGMTQPFPACEYRALYLLAVAAPVAQVAFTFAIASIARSRAMVLSSWLLGLLAGAVVFAAGYLAERLMYGPIHLYATAVLLAAGGVMALLGGYKIYVRKEGVPRPGGGFAGAWIVLIIVIVIGMVLLTLLMYQGSEATDAAHSARTEADQARRAVQSRLETIRPSPPERKAVPKPATRPATRPKGGK